MNSSQSIILGITGGIACGKTEVGRILSENGFKVLDCDLLAHELMNKGCSVYQDVVNRFGEKILAADGEIDRMKLGQRVFDNPPDRAALNRLVHPAVIEAAQRWKADCRAVHRNAAVLVPLLFEAGWTGDWDAIVCITASDEQIFHRLERRGLSPEEARKRIAAQMPIAEKAAKADFVIQNNGTLKALHEAIMNLIEKIRGEQRNSYE
jgi:dephospho-CoA kinase